MSARAVVTVRFGMYGGAYIRLRTFRLWTGATSNGLQPRVSFGLNIITNAHGPRLGRRSRFNGGARYVRAGFRCRIPTGAPVSAAVVLVRQRYVSRAMHVHAPNEELPRGGIHIYECMYVYTVYQVMGAIRQEIVNPIVSQSALRRTVRRLRR